MIYKLRYNKAMGRLVFASLITLGIISSFVFGAVILTLLFFDAVDLRYAIGLTVFFNVLMWYIGPFFTDLINRWVYKVHFLTPVEVAARYPHVAEIIKKVTDQYKFKFPKVGIIPDRNPTAFSYGSGRFNSRIVLTEGIFEFLSQKETQAVVAHELGHIVNRDFIVMMIASTLLQLLYEIYATLSRSGSRKSEGGGKAVALVVYIFYIVGIYLVYYLSRTREYLADEFASKTTSPKDLADALVKIAYGIVSVPDDARAQRLLQSTRHLGIIDVKNAKHIGVVSHATNSDPKVLSEVMVFDHVSPWAKLIELTSTHPLTGNRLDHLSDLSKHHGYQFSFDIDGAIARMRVDKGRLYALFFSDIAISLLPLACAVISYFFLPLQFIPAAFGAGLLLEVFYKFPLSEPVATTIFDQMRDPYASPVRGKPVLLSGEVIGKGVPGYIFSEDMMFKDKTGLTFLDYNSFFGFIGNLFFALGKIKTLFNVPARATGWFKRGMGPSVSLKYLQTDTQRVRSHPITWAVIVPLILIGVSAYWYMSGFDVKEFFGEL